MKSQATWNSADSQWHVSGTAVGCLGEGLARMDVFRALFFLEMRGGRV
jgi:hypothetical protein